MKNTTYLAIQLGTVTLLTICIIIGFQYRPEQITIINNASNCETCNMRFNAEGMKGIAGVYHHDSYYCVWTGEINGEPQEARDIAETTFHELAHYYAYHDPEHFNVNTT